jgi:hypothetical protein
MGSNPLSAALRLRSIIHIPGSLEALPAKPPHANPPIPPVKIPPAQWALVLQRAAQGELLRETRKALSPVL